MRDDVEPENGLDARKALKQMVEQARHLRGYRHHLDLEKIAHYTMSPGPGVTWERRAMLLMPPEFAHIAPYVEAFGASSSDFFRPNAAGIDLIRKRKALPVAG